MWVSSHQADQGIPLLGSLWRRSWVNLNRPARFGVGA